MRILLIILCSMIGTFPAYANEGAGLITRDVDGALPKTLWEEQKRSDIVTTIKQLIVDSPYKTVQQIKRNLLLSSYDTKNIKNDIPANEGNDLLTVRLEKLAQMGLWEDALKLYNTVVTVPEDNEAQAQIGVTLTLLVKGLSTACLDAKVLKPYFSDAFWDQINAVCNAELYGDKPISTQLGDSTILKALYFEPDFKISADNIASLQSISLFEAGIVFYKKRIEYKNVDLSVISSDIPQKLKNLFISDENAPDSVKEKLKSAVEEAIPESATKSVTQTQLIQSISNKLRRDERIDESDFQELYDFAEEYPENYFYMTVINAIHTKYGNNVIGEDKINLGVEKITEKDPKSMKLLHSLLDKDTELSNNHSTIYEKEIGVLLLNVLNELSKPYLGNIGDKSLDKRNMPLNQLRNVGLIQQTNLIAREILANLMQSQL